MSNDCNAFNDNVQNDALENLAIPSYYVDDDCQVLVIPDISHRNALTADLDRHGCLLDHGLFIM